MLPRFDMEDSVSSNHKECYEQTCNANLVSLRVDLSPAALEALDYFFYQTFPDHAFAQKKQEINNNDSRTIARLPPSTTTSTKTVTRRTVTTTTTTTTRSDLEGHEKKRRREKGNKRKQNDVQEVSSSNASRTAKRKAGEKTEEVEPTVENAESLPKAPCDVTEEEDVYTAVENPMACRRKAGPLEEYKHVIDFDSHRLFYLVLWLDNSKSWIPRSQFAQSPNYAFRKKHGLKLEAGDVLFWWRAGYPVNSESAKFRTQVRVVHSIQTLIDDPPWFGMDTPVETQHNCVLPPTWTTMIMVWKKDHKDGYQELGSGPRQMYYLRDFDLIPGVNLGIQTKEQELRKAGNKERARLKKEYPFFRKVIQGKDGR